MTEPVDTGAIARLRAAALPRLHPDWLVLLRRAWSIRLIVLAGVLSFADVVCSVLIVHPPFNPVWFAVLAGFFSAASFVARLIAQKNMGGSE